MKGKKRKARPARLDPKGTEKPLTEIHARIYVSPSGRQYPDTHLEYTVKDVDPHEK